MSMGNSQCQVSALHCQYSTYTLPKSMLTAYKSILGPIVTVDIPFCDGFHHGLTWCERGVHAEYDPV